MHTDTPEMKKPTGGRNHPAGHTDGAIVPALADDGKAFSTLQAAFALRGHQLHRSIGPDGAQAFWAERWGLARYLPSLHDAALFLAQIGGRV